MTRLLARLTAFGRDSGGQLSIEAAIMFPLLLLIYVSTYTYFASYRADSGNVKAAYSVGDMLSRETKPINGSYVDGLNNVFSYMTMARQPTWIRVSTVTFDSTKADFVLKWSNASGGHAPATLDEIRDAIPPMAAGDTVIVVETFMPYVPAFNVGLKPMLFHNVVVTRPRFAPQLCWNACT